MIEIKIVEQTETALLLKLSGVDKNSGPTIDRGLAKAAAIVVKHIKQDLLSGQVLKNRTGNLRRAVTFRMSPGVATIFVGKEANYGRYHEFGVNHSWTITPSRKSVLAFEVSGDTVFARRVIHPPLPERSFMRQGLADEADEVLRVINEEVGKLVKE